MYRAALVCVAAVCAASALAEAPANQQSQLEGSTGFQGTHHSATVMNEKLRVLRAKLAAAQAQVAVAGGHNKLGAANGTRAVRRFRL